MERNLLIRKVLFKYLPVMILVSLTSTVATFINTFLTAIWLNGEDVVLISTPSFLNWYLAITGSMVATGSSVIFLRYLAKGDRERAVNSYSIATYTAVVVGAIFLAISLLYYYLLMQGDTPLSQFVSAQYVAALGISAIPLLLLQVEIMFLRMDGDRDLALICFMVYIIVDITSVWITVQNGLGPFGVGLSVGIGSAVAMLFTPIHYRREDQNMKLIKPFELLKGMKRISSIGFRSLLNRVSMVLRYYFLKVFMVTTGVGVTACLISQNTVLHFVIAVYTGSAIMSAALTGVFYQQGSRKSLVDTVRELSKLATIISVIIAVIVLALSEGITGLLVSGEESYNSALACLRWFAISIPTTTLCMIIIYMYQSTKRKVLASIMVLVRGVALIVLCVLLLAPILGEAAIWTCFLLSDLCVLALMFLMAWVHNRRLPRNLDDLMMLHGKLFDEPSVYDGSIMNSREELNGMLSEIEGRLSDGSFEEETVRKALDGIEAVIGDTIDRGYADRDVHEIDVLVRKDKGLNITIRDDSTEEIRLPEGVRRARSLGLNIYYMDVGVPAVVSSKFSDPI